MKISYLLGFKIDEFITGGQKYDWNLISILKEKTSHQITIDTIDVKIKKFLFLSPIEYFFRGLKKRDYDIALINSIFFMRFALLPFSLRKIFKKKLITIHHHFMYRQFEGTKRKIYEHFEWRFLRNMDKVIVASPYVFEELKKKIPVNKLELLQIPFEKTASQEVSPIQGNLTYIGTIETRKGLIYLMESMKQLKARGRSYPLTIVGKIMEQDYYDELLKIIKENELNVTFTGYLSKEEIDNILVSTDVFVFPSLLEGYGMAIIEAQVYGLPIVSFDNSAMPYNVKDHINGYAVKTGDTKKFADAIEKIVEDRELRAKLSHGAIENLKNQNTSQKFEKDVIKFINTLSNKF